MSMKVAVIGAKKAGKSTICSLITSNSYDPQCLPTTTVQTMMVRVGTVALHVEDTPGIPIGGSKDRGDERKAVLAPPVAYE